MTDIEQQVREGLADDRWALPAQPDPRAAITALAVRRRRSRQLGSVVGAAALVAAAIAVPQALDDGGRPVPGASDTTTGATSTPPDQTGAPNHPTDSAVPVRLRSIDFRLAPGATVEDTAEIRLVVYSAMCSNPVLPGDIEPRTTYGKGVFEVALYAVERDDYPQDPQCIGGLQTTPYTIHLLQPLVHREVVLDHSPPDNPPDAVPVPADAVPTDYVDPQHPDRATWTSVDNGGGLSLWYRGYADTCNPPTGYLSLLFPADGVATFVPSTSDEPTLALPPNALDTGWRAGPVQFWTSRDYSTGYLVVNGRIQAWDKAPTCVYQAFKGRSR